jgi:hypothetical protein
MRKGLGKGLGQGYYNIAPMDSHIHSLSARGYKSIYLVKMKHKTALLNALDRANVGASVDLKNREDGFGLVSVLEVTRQKGKGKQVLERWAKQGKVIKVRPVVPEHDLLAKGKKELARGWQKAIPKKKEIKEKEGKVVGYNPEEDEFFYYQDFQAKGKKSFKSYDSFRKEISKRDYQNIEGLKAEITEKDYDYFLNVLPPIEWKGNAFYMSEFYTGDLTAKFYKKGSKYFVEVVDFRKEFPKISDKEYLMRRF